MTGARLKHYGWGREGEGMTEDERKFVLGRYHTKFGTNSFTGSAAAGKFNLPWEFLDHPTGL